MLLHRDAHRQLSEPLSTSTRTFTSNCYACTLFGDIAENPTCGIVPIDGCTPTPTAVPMAVVHLPNNSIPIGHENNRNSGADLRNEVFQKLQALCPDGANTCNSTIKAEILNIKAVVGSKDGLETLKFTIQDSGYGSKKERDQLLAAGIASWQAAVAKTCKEVQYEEVQRNHHCGTNGPVRRGTPEPHSCVLRKDG